MNKFVKTVLCITLITSFIFGAYLFSNQSLEKVFADTAGFSLKSGSNTYYSRISNSYWATGVSYDYSRWENITGSSGSAYMNSLRIDNADSNRSACYGIYSVVDSEGGTTDKRYYSLWMEVVDGEEYMSLGGYRADNTNLYTRLNIFANKSCVDGVGGSTIYDMFVYE